MKFVFGVIVGAALLWLYSSQRVRGGTHQSLDAAQAWVQQLRHVAATGASSGAQRVSEMIDAAPVPDPVKSTAGEVAFNAWAAADSLAQQPAGDAAEPASTEHA